MGSNSSTSVPASDRRADAVQGHWLLARLGKRVLRPGGIELTRTLLRHARVHDADVVELAPGLGRTASEIIARGPRSYHGVDQDPDAARAAGQVVAGAGRVHVANAADTGLPDASADVVIGEAMLTMQGAGAKATIIAEAARLLRPGGRYAIHELGLTPDDLAESVKTEVRQALARAIKVNARPLTAAEWSQLLADQGLEVMTIETSPMALLEPRRLISDEGVRGAARFVRNLAFDPAARRRVWAMRQTFRTHRANMNAIAIIARKP